MLAAMHTYPKCPRDPNQLGRLIVDLSVGKAIEESISHKAAKDPAAVSLGQRGGKARASKLTAEQRSEIASKAASRRWSRKN
jgi:hypothetical protein